MRLSPLARRECLTIAVAGGLLALAAVAGGVWWLGPPPLVAAGLAMLFFRDPERRTPAERRAWVAVADGKVTSVHEVEHCEPLGEGALCVRVFISLLDAHVVRSPAHARVGDVADQAGGYGNALKPRHLETNAARTLTLRHPVRDEPLAAIRLIAGAFARTIETPLQPGATLQRGERLGLIKLGSTAELYVPLRLKPVAVAAEGSRVKAGETVLVRIDKTRAAAAAAPPAAGGKTEATTSQS